jgi:hypothetical protein
MSLYKQCLKNATIAKQNMEEKIKQDCSISLQKFQEKILLESKNYSSIYEQYTVTVSSYALAKCISDTLNNYGFSACVVQYKDRQEIIVEPIMKRD